MLTDDFDYDLPAELIAQTPVEPRDRSRLLVLNRKNGEIQHAHFFQLGEFLRKGDILVWNETRVIPARLYAHKKPSGGKVELLLLKRLDDHRWEILVGGKGLTTGKVLQVENGPLAQICAVYDGARREIRFSEPVEPYLGQAGHVPLPPYIHTPLEDPERYQTIYARQPGSAAAPTAGLHFTEALIDQLSRQGILFASLTLHVGLDTFIPVTEQHPEEHKIHTEWCELTPQNALKINQAIQNGGRVIAVGTTSVRCLESAARHSTGGDRVAPFQGPTDLYILPGFKFRAVDGMITNFHLPRSTLVMLVSAFTSREMLLQTYEVAKQERYRFYSFGDAMLIL